jgi:hypothetical protein
MAGFWSSVYDFTKDMGPVIAAGASAWVAVVAYKVSKEAAEATQAQRDIAANQYKISLYEIRAEKYNNILKWKNKEWSSHDLSLKSIDELIVIVMDLENLCNANLYSEEISSIRFEVERRQLNLTGYIFCNITENDHEEKRELEQEIQNYKYELLTIAKKIIIETRYFLQVPQEPF